MREKDREANTARWRRREQRRLNQRNRLKKHGAAFGRVYRDAILKRLRRNKGG